MKRDKLKKIDIRYFIYPFLISATLFLLIGYFTVQNRIEERYATFEENALNLAHTYSQALISTREAEDIIKELLDHNIGDAISALQLFDNLYNTDVLEDIANSFHLDEVHLYNPEGVIVFSKGNKYIGWKAYEGHPVYDFMVGDADILVEDIRKDTESDQYYKYAYVKNEDGSFIQIGVLSDYVYNFIAKFEMQNIVESISKFSETKHVTFVDDGFKVIASTLDSFKGIRIEDPKVQERLISDTNEVTRVEIEGEDTYQVCVPIYHMEERLGSLSIGWSTDETDKEIIGIIQNGILIFFVIVLIIGAVIFFAFRKSKENITVAYYDKLTGLPNKEYLYEFLENEIRKIDKEKKAILMLNVKNFKTLNITYGYDYANEILSEMAMRIYRVINDEDMFFHFGGDRFIIYVDQHKYSNDLVVLSQRILSTLNEPFHRKDEVQMLNIEIAILEVDDKDITVDRILQDATLALSTANKDMTNSIIVFNKEMEDKIKRVDMIEKSLLRVINRETESLYLEFQPKLDLKKNRIIGFEALARMETQALGRLSPLEFIEIAESRLLIYDLGKIIIEKSCEFLNTLGNAGYKDMTIAINISGIQLLRDEFIGDVINITNKYGINPKLLEFEITESILMDNYNLINKKLQEIKSLGIMISIDDFGTGFSSLARLKSLNVDIVKIDRFFINRISMKEEDNLISADIISMCHKIGLMVVAEGVETSDQLEYLIKYDCDIIQGYYLSRPLPKERAIVFLEHYKE